MKRCKLRKYVARHGVIVPSYLYTTIKVVKLSEVTGKQFKNLINERGLKQCDVAKEINVHPTSLNSFLNGRNTYLNKSKYYILCQYLKLDIYY